MTATIGGIPRCAWKGGKTSSGLSAALFLQIRTENIVTYGL